MDLKVPRGETKGPQQQQEKRTGVARPAAAAFPPLVSWSRITPQTRRTRLYALAASARSGPTRGTTESMVTIIGACAYPKARKVAQNPLVAQPKRMQKRCTRAAMMKKPIGHIKIRPMA